MHIDETQKERLFNAVRNAFERQGIYYPDEVMSEIALNEETRAAFAHGLLQSLSESPVPPLGADHPARTVEGFWQFLQNYFYRGKGENLDIGSP